ncbi:hypothetical protein HPP92_026898 [Vanilla planifolia]|uniref:Uncharacterized protein n=1 Tax=Vanilla planifolia TaxID=51239 RepID=A0A835PB74_VANPL|nr:hypothetical protein HPP92_026898 [Vanilla planifolia]
MVKSKEHLQWETTRNDLNGSQLKTRVDKETLKSMMELYDPDSVLPILAQIRVIGRKRVKRVALTQCFISILVESESLSEDKRVLKWNQFHLALDKYDALTSEISGRRSDRALKSRTKWMGGLSLVVMFYFELWITKNSMVDLDNDKG